MGGTDMGGTDMGHPFKLAMSEQSIAGQVLPVSAITLRAEQGALNSGCLGFFPSFFVPFFVFL